jgi:hypothetical protein
MIDYAGGARMKMAAYSPKDHTILLLVLTFYFLTIYSPGSAHEQLTRGKNTSVLAWEHYLKMARCEEEIVKALGFPRADK